MGTAVPRPAPREKKPRRPLRTTSELKRTRLNPGDKPLQRSPMKHTHKLKVNPSKEFLAAIAERDGDRCQFPNCTRRVNPRRRPHRIINGSAYELDKCVRLCDEHHDVGEDNPHGLRAWLHKPFWQRCMELKMLGEVYRAARLALARTMGLIERG